MDAQPIFEQAENYVLRMEIEQALQTFDLAEKADYDADQCSAGRWNCHMLRGDFELAWRESDKIRNRGKADPNQFWDGRPFAGRKVLLRCLHGLGDTLQFVRYAPLIRQQAQSLTIEAQPALKQLLRASNMADEVITWGDPEPSWDQQVEVMELPRIFRTTLDSIPNGVPYLRFPFDNAASLNGKRGPLRVGLVWASSSYNPARSVPIMQLVELFGTPDTLFFSLQAGAERNDLAPWSELVADWHAEAACVFPTARALLQLDLVITVDTMMAHLAGALGRTVWTLLPYQCDWRWMREGEHSPWYPTMHLFRQAEPNNWRPVIERVKTELKAKADITR